MKALYPKKPLTKEERRAVVSLITDGDNTYCATMLLQLHSLCKGMVASGCTSKLISEFAAADFNSLTPENPNVVNKMCYDLLADPKRTDRKYVKAIVKSTIVS